MTHPDGADMRAAVGDMVADLLDAVREASEAVELERHVLPFLVCYEQVRPTVDLDDALVSSFSETGSPEAANALAVLES